MKVYEVVGSKYSRYYTKCCGFYSSKIKAIYTIVKNCRCESSGRYLRGEYYTTKCDKSTKWKEVEKEHRIQEKSNYYNDSKENIWGLQTITELYKILIKYPFRIYDPHGEGAFMIREHEVIE